MARLGAFGSKELARFVRVVKDEADGSTHRTTYSVRDDGRVLIKRDGTYASRQYGSDEKVLLPLRGTWTRARSGATRKIVRLDDTFTLDRLRARLVGLGYEEVRP